MASEDKRFPATELKLTRLRQAGVIPLTADCLTFAAYLGMLLGVVSLIRVSSAQLTTASEVVFRSTAADEGSANALMDLAAAFGMSVLAFLVPLVLAVCIVGALQTKFLLTFSQLGLNFSRLFQWPAVSVGRSLSGLFYVLRSAAWITVSILCIRYFFDQLQLLPRPAFSYIQDLFQASNNKSGAIAKISQLFLVPGMEMLMQTLRTLLLITFFVAVVSYVLTWLKFKREHMMTRGEVESEQREQEQSPEFSQRRRDIQSEQAFIGDANED